MGVITTITLITALLAGNAFFVAAEFALISSRRDRIENLITGGNTGDELTLPPTTHPPADDDTTPPPPTWHATILAMEDRRVDKVLLTPTHPQ